MASLDIWIDGLILDSRAAGIGQYIRSLFEAYAIEFPEDALHGVFRPDIAVSGVPSVVVPNVLSSRQRLWYEQMVLPGHLKDRKYDVIHFPDYQVPLYRSVPRMVMTVHDLAAFVIPEVFPRAKAHTKRWLMRQSVKRAAHIIVPSDATRQDLVNILSVPPEKISVVWHGVKRSTPPLVGRMHDRPYFLAVGTIEPRKNFLGLIQAYHRLLASEGDIPDLLIAGRLGWMYEETLAMPAKLGVADRVKFLQYVSEGTLAALYRDAVAMVYPSFYEGFGLPVIEAMADGIPVVTSRQGALAEVGGDAVWSVDPYDVLAISEAMREVMVGGVQVDKRVEAARAWSQQLTWERAARLTRAVYQHVSQGG